MDEALERKLDKLRKSIRKLDSVLVAYSGGVDSTFLLRICREELGEKAVAVTTYSSSYPEDELSLARRVAKVMGARHITLEKDEDDVLSRLPDMHHDLLELAAQLELKHVLDGSHKDDEGDRSKSLRAAKKAGVKSPLLDSGLTKSEVRLLAKGMGLPNWDKTSSSKARKGKSKKKVSLAKLEKAKKVLAEAGAENAGVLVEAKLLVVSLDGREMVAIARKMKEIRRKIRKLGFSDIVLRLSS
jgi:uncharacterized protein